MTEHSLSPACPPVNSPFADIDVGALMRPRVLRSMMGALRTECALAEALHDTDALDEALAGFQALVKIREAMFAADPTTRRIWLSNPDAGSAGGAR
jgi:hypothetical protein